MLNSQSKIKNQKLKISIVVAMTDNRVIGRGNALPWRLPDDLKRFKQLTSGHTVVMGRKTFESIGRPLPNRRNIVVTRSDQFQVEGVETAGSVEAAIELAGAEETEVFIVGGEQIYRAALPLTDRIYLTQIHTVLEGDAFFPEVDPAQWLIKDNIHHKPNANHAYAMSFLLMIRRGQI